MVCIQNCESNLEHEIIFFNITHEYNKESILRNNPSSIKRKQSLFLKLPAFRILYSLPQYVTNLFESLESLENENDSTVVRRGLDTGAVSRFVRAYWEVSKKLDWIHIVREEIPENGMETVITSFVGVPRKQIV